MLFTVTLCFPQFCENAFLVITFELKHIGWWFWCVRLCFGFQGIIWFHLFLPLFDYAQSLIFDKHEIGHYLAYQYQECALIFTCASLGRPIPKVFAVCMFAKDWYIMFTAIVQKYIWRHNFCTKAYRMMIVVSGTMFSGSRNLLAPFVLMLSLFVCLSIRPSIYPSVCPSVSLCLWLVCRSVCPMASQSVCLSVWKSGLHQVYYLQSLEAVDV